MISLLQANRDIMKSTILLSITILLVGIFMIVSCGVVTTITLDVNETQTIMPSLNQPSIQGTSTTNSLLPKTTSNQEMVNPMDSINLETYMNSRHGYYIDYPTSWTINDTNIDAVVIKSESYQDAMIIAVNNLGSVELDQYIEDQMLWFVIGSYEIEIIEKVEFIYENYPVKKVDFHYFIVEDDDMYQARAYFIIKNDMIYQLFTSASQPDFLYDPIASFNFLE